MKRNCNFQMNLAFAVGITLLCIGILIHNVLGPRGSMDGAANFLSGAGCGSILVGLLYGSPKTRPLFDRFRAFKLRLLGRK